MLSGQILGPAFGRTDFSRIFIFEPPDFFADFLAGFFLLILWEKVPRKILQENLRENPPKFIQQKSSNTFLQIAQGNKFAARSCRGFFTLGDRCWLPMKGRGLEIASEGRSQAEGKRAWVPRAQGRRKVKQDLKSGCVRPRQETETAISGHLLHWIF